MHFFMVKSPRPCNPKRTANSNYLTYRAVLAKIIRKFTL